MSHTPWFWWVFYTLKYHQCDSVIQQLGPYCSCFHLIHGILRRVSYVLWGTLVSSNWPKKLCGHFWVCKIQLLKQKSSIFIQPVSVRQMIRSIFVFYVVPCWRRRAFKCLSAALARSLRMESVFSQLFENKHTEALLSLLVKGILVICQPGSEEIKSTAEFMESSIFSPLGGKQCTWEKHQLTVVSLWKQILDLWNTQWSKMVVKWKPVWFLVASRKGPCLHSLRIPNIYVVENTCLSDPAESLLELPH